MRTKSFIIFLMMIVLVGILPAEETPQIAVKLLESYIYEKAAEGDSKGGDIFLTASGGILLCGGITMMILPDYLELGPIGKYATWGSVAGVGGILTTIGIIGLFSEPEDPRKQFSYILDEEDPKVKEALCAGELKKLADEAKNNRILSGFSSLLYSGVFLGGHIIGAVADEEDINVGYILSVSISPLIGAMSDFFSKSREERLYDQYLTSLAVLGE